MNPYRSTPWCRRNMGREPDRTQAWQLSILFFLPGGNSHACSCELLDGEAKFWLEPEIELARNFRLTGVQLQEARALIEVNVDEIRAAWHRHFPG